MFGKNMSFENLSKSAKLEYWKDIESDILSCLVLADRCVPMDLADQIRDYVSHNELGIALELLADSIVEYDWEVPLEARSLILRTFKKMEYDKSDVEQYLSYETQLSPRI